MKFSDIFWTMTLIRHASRPDSSDDDGFGGKEENLGCGCLTVIIMLIVGACIIFG